MALLSLLEITNKVLIRLRESTVSATSDNEYSTLVAEFVKEAVREVEDAWNWKQLHTTTQHTLTVATRTQTLSGSSSRTRIIGVWNTTKKWPISVLNNTHYISNLVSLDITSSSSPTCIDRYGYDTTSGAIQFRVEPLASAADVLTFYTIQPQETLVDATKILVPNDPVIQLAYLKAINERGEDQGRASEIQEKIFRTALADAIANEAETNNDEITWRLV